MAAPAHHLSARRPDAFSRATPARISPLCATRVSIASTMDAIAKHISPPSAPSRLQSWPERRFRGGPGDKTPPPEILRSPWPRTGSAPSNQQGCHSGRQRTGLQRLRPLHRDGEHRNCLRSRQSSCMSEIAAASIEGTVAPAGSAINTRICGAAQCGQNGLPSSIV